MILIDSESNMTSRTTPYSQDMYKLDCVLYLLLAGSVWMLYANYWEQVCQMLA